MQNYLGILFALFIVFSSAIKHRNLIFDRAAVTYHNPKYVSDVFVSLKRYNRTSPYIFNYHMIIKDPWGVNITIQLRTYEFRDNQYKESIIKTNEHVCHLIEKDIIVTGILWKYSNLPKKCPAVGLFEIVDYKMEDSTFLPQIPPSKWRFNFNLVQNINKEMILKFEAHVQVKEPIPKKRS